MDQGKKHPRRGAWARTGALIAGVICGLPIGIGLSYGLRPEARPEVITRDGGGSLVLAGPQANQYLADRRRLIIDGICASACTVMVSTHMDNVCVTPRARLGFHLARDWRSGRTSTLQPAYPRALGAWIAQHGGLTRDLLWMDYSEARRFWRTCEPSDWA